jgi:2-hydroxychromene-2-carboxylate isomerase
MNRTIDFYFFIGSTYSYLSVARAEREAAKAGVSLRWTPFSVRTLMREQDNSPFAGKPVKLQYMWRDLERRAQRFGIPFATAPDYPIDADQLANRVATLASIEGWCEQFTQAAYESWFLHNRDPGVTDHLRAILQQLGQNADRCLDQAASDVVSSLYQSRTDRARELGIFGSPTIVVGNEIFWGDDRLEDAFDWSVEHQ